MVRLDTREESRHVGIRRVIAPDRNALSTPLRHFARSVVDRPRDIVRRRAPGHASPGHINDGSGSAELGRDAPASAAACAGDQGDAIVKALHQRSGRPVIRTFMSACADITTIVSVVPVEGG
jgi:hypothetical protein